MAIALIVVVATVTLVARTRLWWLPGVVVAACALPILGYYLGSPDEYWRALGAATTGILLTSAILGFASVLSLVSYGMHRLMHRKAAE
jgi:hypothetical protein